MISKLKKAYFTVLGFDSDSNNPKENCNEILKIPEYENLDEKTNSWNIFIRKDNYNLNKSFYSQDRYNEILGKIKKF